MVKRVVERSPLGTVIVWGFLVRGAEDLYRTYFSFLALVKDGKVTHGQPMPRFTVKGV